MYIPACNSGEHTTRHHATNRAWRDALAAVATGTVLLGDKQEAERYKQYNADHVPDMYRIGSPNVLWELKCYTPFLAPGSQRQGTRGAVCTTDGHNVAFGNTLESLTVKVFGTAARGAPGDEWHDRKTGKGRVRERKGDYADALAKRNTVRLLLAETTGALSRDFVRMIRALAEQARSADGVDSTTYGTGRASTRSFYRHHLAAISCAIQNADAHTILNNAASRDFILTHS